MNLGSRHHFTSIEIIEKCDYEATEHSLFREEQHNHASPTRSARCRDQGRSLALNPCQPGIVSNEPMVEQVRDFATTPTEDPTDIPLTPPHVSDELYKRIDVELE